MRKISKKRLMKKLDKIEKTTIPKFMTSFFIIITIILIYAGILEKKIMYLKIMYFIGAIVTTLASYHWFKEMIKKENIKEESPN